MNKKNAVAIGVAIVIIAAVSIAWITYERIDQKSGIDPRKWIVSGHFALQKYEHKLGEPVFMVVDGLKIDEKGQIIIATPAGEIYKKISFDGSIKTGFNHYFKPDTTKTAKLCSPDDLVGVWTIIFEGVTDQPLEFEIINEFIVGTENDLIELC